MSPTIPGIDSFALSRERAVGEPITRSNDQLVKALYILRGLEPAGGIERPICRLHFGCSVFKLHRPCSFVKCTTSIVDSVLWLTSSSEEAHEFRDKVSCSRTSDPKL